MIFPAVPPPALAEGRRCGTVLHAGSGRLFLSRDKPGAGRGVGDFFRDQPRLTGAAPARPAQPRGLVAAIEELASIGLEIRPAATILRP
jgi:hypothetical protein